MASSLVRMTSFSSSSVRACQRVNLMNLRSIIAPPSRSSAKIAGGALSDGAGARGFFTNRPAQFRHIAQPLRVKVKQMTGMAGLPVQPRWREILIKMCNQGLEELRTKIPEGVFYRITVENTLKHWLKIVNEYDDYEIVEDLIDRGQVEELILMVEDELMLIPKMAEWKPWAIDQKNVNQVDELLKERDFVVTKEHVFPDLQTPVTDNFYQTALETSAKIEAERAAQKQAQLAAQQAQAAAQANPAEQAKK